jgi:DNA repair exonuclease SbcCD ATPase subunit
MALAGCASLAPGIFVSQPAPPQDCLPTIEEQAHQRAQSERLMQLESKVERLTADLQQAEEALIATESGLRGIHTRADSVSRLAEARIRVGRAARAAPWRAERVSEAQEKLEEAERQLAAGHFGSAIFFGSRAQRIANELIQEAEEIRQDQTAKFVQRKRVNLRSGPSTEETILGVLERHTPVFLERSEGNWALVRTTSGTVGWVHASLISVR